MTAYVRHLIVAVIIIGFYQIAYYLACAEAEQCIFREIAVVDERIEDNKHEITVKTVIAAYFRYGVVARAEIYAETVDYGNHRRLMDYHVAHACVTVY